MIKIEKISLSVAGMTCASCVARVEKTIKKFKRISNVNLNLATEKVTLDYDPEIVDLNKIYEIRGIIKKRQPRYSKHGNR